MAQDPAPGVKLGADRPPPPADVLSRFTQAAQPLPPAGSDEPGAPSSPPVRVALPPHYFLPAYGAQPFYQFQSSSVAGPGTAWAPAAITLKVPPTLVAIVRLVGMGVLNMVATTQVTAVLRFGGAPQAPVRQMPAQPAAFVGAQWDTVAYVSPPGAVIDLLLTVIDNATYTVTGFYEGWLIPKEQWAKWSVGV